MRFYRGSFAATREIKIGDKMPIDLKDRGEFLATVHALEKNRTLLIFDDYVGLEPMYGGDTILGDFESSDLKIWMNTELIALFPALLQRRISELTIPSVGQVYGHQSVSCVSNRLEIDNDAQLILMKNPVYRTALYHNRCNPGWLRNGERGGDCSYVRFASARSSRCVDLQPVIFRCGVRPEFWLER